MAKIFISYRRGDAQWQAKAIYDELSKHVANPRENIFFDIDSMSVGFDYEQQIKTTIEQCQICLAVIGQTWLKTADPSTGQPRLHNKRDWVRAEIAAALARNIRVVPVLLDGVAVPEADDLPDDLKELAKRQGVKVSADRFQHDVGVLVRGLGLVPLPDRLATTSRRTSVGAMRTTVAITVLVALVGLGLWGLLTNPLGWFGSENAGVNVAREADGVVANGEPAPSANVSCDLPGLVGRWKCVKGKCSTEYDTSALYEEGGEYRWRDGKGLVHNITLYHESIAVRPVGSDSPRSYVGVVMSCDRIVWKSGDTVSEKVRE